MKQLSDSFIRTLDEDIGESTINIVDTTIDLLASDNSIIKEIPFISIVCSVFKIGNSIAERHHLLQVQRFVKEIRDNNINGEKKEKFKKEYEEKTDEERNKELEYIVLILSKYLSSDKPRYLSMLFINYVDKKINWDEFASYAEIIDRFLPGDTNTLAMGDQKDVHEKSISPSLLRLAGLGLYRTIKNEEPVKVVDSTLHVSSQDSKDYQLTKFGRTLRECIGLSSREAQMNAILSNIPDIENRREEK